MNMKWLYPIIITLVIVTSSVLIVAPIPRVYAPANCPSINAIGNFLTSSLVGASFTSDGTTVTYVFDSWVDTSPTGGVPGLIEYCVYPSQPPGNPTSATSATAFVTDFGAIQGFFGFVRSGGDPTNIPLDGTNPITMGTATWPLGTAPVTQTIVLHINDEAECSALYGAGTSSCFVLPTREHPPPPTCNGDPACKQVTIDEAITTTPLTVPGGVLLHIHYLYVIINQPTNTFNMIFNPPAASTKDINTGGGKDYFGCEQQPDPLGAPGAWGTYPNYQGTGFTLNFVAGTGGGCPQSRFFLTAPGPGPITLAPGQSITFTIDMVTRINKGKNQEYTSCGLHVLNSGFTVKWIQSDDGLLHSFATNPPISVNVVGLPACPTPT